MTDLSGRLASQGGRRLVLRLKLARAALLWERVWPAAWPALCVLGGFAVLALFDLLSWLPGFGHAGVLAGDRKSTRLNSSHEWISYAVFCLKKKNQTGARRRPAPAVRVR